MTSDDKFPSWGRSANSAWRSLLLIIQAGWKTKPSPSAQQIRCHGLPQSLCAGLGAKCIHMLCSSAVTSGWLIHICRDERLFHVGSPFNFFKHLMHLIVAAFFWIPETLVDLPLFCQKKSLGNRQAPWRPTFAVNGSLVAGNFGGDGLVSLEMPCGTLDAEAPPLDPSLSLETWWTHENH